MTADESLPAPRRQSSVFVVGPGWPGTIAWGEWPTGETHVSLFGQGIFHFSPGGRLTRCALGGAEFVAQGGSLHELQRANPPFSDPETESPHWMPPPGMHDSLGATMEAELAEGILQALRNDLTLLLDAIEEGAASATGHAHTFPDPNDDLSAVELVEGVLASREAEDPQAALDRVADWIGSVRDRLAIG